MSEPMQPPAPRLERGYASPPSPVVRDLLERNAQDAPDEVAVVFEDGTTWTWRQALLEAYACANRLHDLGFRQGERLGVRLPNGRPLLRLWWGLACGGMVMVPINPALKGDLLSHLITISAVTTVVAEDGDGDLDHAAVTHGLHLLHVDELTGVESRPPELERPLQPWDTLALILTSGTTGPSKLVTVTYEFAGFSGAGFCMVEGLGPDDCFLIDLPMFHMAALSYACGALGTRTRIALRTRPSLDRYWEVASEVGATAALLLSTLIDAIVQAPPSPSERGHTLTKVLMSPIPSDATAFAARFGLETIATTYGSTEVPSAMRGYSTDPAATIPGYVGRPYDGYTARLVDENDVEVEPGRAGELVLRSETPWLITPAYFGDSAATARAWRNGWFHTGDLMRCDESGHYFFVGRSKDALRRRGENISAYEVETVIMRHAAVAEAACVAYPSDAGVDDEVKVWLVLDEGHADVPFDELLRFAHAGLPHYMVPRYFEVTAALPKTPSLRVQKHVLRELGNGAQTWDRELHGFRITRHGLQHG